MNADFFFEFTDLVFSLLTASAAPPLLHLDLPLPLVLPLQLPRPHHRLRE